MTKKIVVFILFLNFMQLAMAQTHQWAKLIERSAVCESLSVDSNNNSYMLGITNDTLTIDGKNILSPTTKKNRGIFLARFNSKGKLIWVNRIYTYGNADSFVYGQVKSVSNNRVAVYGEFFGKILKLSATDSIVNTNYLTTLGFIAIYDSSGKFIKVRKTFEGVNYSINWGSLFNGQMDIDKKGNFYIHFYKDYDSGVIYNKGGTIALNNKISRSVLAKYSSGLDSVLWYKELPDYNTFSVRRLRIGEDDNLYLACMAKGKFRIDSVNYGWQKQKIKGFLIVFSSKGTYVHSGLINSDTSQQDYFFDVAARDIRNIYISGQVQDSILFKSKWYSSLNKKSSGVAYQFCGLVSIPDGVKWINFTKDKGGHLFQGQFPQLYTGRLTFDKMKNVYGSYYYWHKGITFGGLSDTGLVPNFITKFDSLGNALWLMSTYGERRNMEPDYDTNLIYTGGMSIKEYLNPFTLTTKYPSLFIAKIVDYSITRGNVSYGPYCAGDSLIIPYKKRGIYDSANYFIAELSDENGNFEGKERELGRIQSIGNGYIKGILPLFKVATSANYRIRIRSTSPIVQSFYKKDSLRLLIYSRDKADPGPTESICYGDSILLNTYGGTKWTWSPKFNMMDSSKRQTRAWPDKTTKYKIIIGDSSGCGAPDTAYKLIIVRRPLKAILNFNDSSLCQSYKLNIPIQLTGGDSINYTYQWYFLNSPKDWFPMKNGNKLRDTLNYTPTDPIEKLALVLTDKCTNKPDTAYLNIKLSIKSNINSKFKDTSICSGQILKYKVSLSGGISKYTQFQWKDVISNTVLSNTDSLKIITATTLKVRLIVNNGCELLGDTVLFNVAVKPPLKAITNLRDTTICFGQRINYTATAQGGDNKNYSYTWVLDKKVTSPTNTYLLKTDDLFTNAASTSTLTLILKDKCSIPNDTIKKTINVKPGPISNFTWDLACSRTPVTFQFTGTKPSSPLTITFNWNFNNEGNSTLENPSYLFSSTGNKAITLTSISSNGCASTLSKTIAIKPQSKADFTASDVCESDSAVFKNLSKDATGYNWKFGDGQSSKSQNPKHKYQITSTTTFNVTLVALVTNGCSDSVVHAVTINQNPNSAFTITNTAGKLDLKASKTGYPKYQWKIEKTDSFTSSNPNYIYTLKAGQKNVCLKVTDASGCISQTCKNANVGISSITKPEGFKIYPNPNTGNFTIEIDNPAKDISLEIYDLLGKLVKIIETSPDKSSYSIDLTGPGIYLVKVRNEGMIWNQKVLVSGENTN